MKDQLKQAWVSDIDPINMFSGSSDVYVKLGLFGLHPTFGFTLGKHPDHVQYQLFFYTWSLYDQSLVW